MSQSAPIAVDKNGAVPFTWISDNSTKGTVIKAAQCNLYAMVVGNSNASARYLRLYDKATNANATTDTPVWRETIPGSTTGAGNNIVFPVGLSFALGLAWRITTGIADTDDNAAGANECLFSVAYKSAT